MLVGYTERSNIRGEQVYYPDYAPGVGEEFKKVPRRSQLIDVVTSRTLNIKDIADPIMVSYIAEYIKFSTSRSGLCPEVAYDVALKLANNALAVEEARLAATGSDEVPELSPIYSDLTEPGSELYKDVLAYYPPRRSDPPTGTDALKYYIAKELQTKETGFLDVFQNFIAVANLDMAASSPPKKSLINCFLDKLQTAGDHFLEDQPATNDWIRYGEGLYMEFYFRRNHDRQVYLPLLHRSRLRLSRDADRDDKMSDSDLFGLRICIRDSFHHGHAGAGYDLAAPDGERSHAFQAILDGPAALFGDEALSAREKSYNKDKGFPIIEHEVSWGEILRDLGTSSFDVVPADVHLAYEDPKSLKRILDYLKKTIVATDDFRVMFEYVFPVKKLFNMLFIMMDQNMSAFLANTGHRGIQQIAAGPLSVSPMPGADPTASVPADGPEEDPIPLPIPDRFGILNASSIDPEQFRKAKGLAKSILVNINN